MANFTSKYTGEEIDQAVEKAGKTSQNLIFKYKDGSTQSFNGSTELEVNLGDGGTEVVANPQTSEDDAELNSIQINGKNYKVLSGIKVVNSLPAATEAEYKRHLLYLYNGNLEYLTEVVADEPAVTTPATLPLILSGSSACTVGTDCYIFGGSDNSSLQNKIIKFDSISQTATTLSATLPSELTLATACVVGTDCYIFGGQTTTGLSNSIIKFDSISQTVTTLPNTLPFNMCDSYSCVVGTDCYIIGGISSTGALHTIIKFDTITQEAVTLSATLPEDITCVGVGAINTNCYIFGIQNSLSVILKFDTITQEVTTLSATLPEVIAYMSVCSLNTDCFLFGGYTLTTSGYSNTIIKFDSVSETTTVLSVTLPVGIAYSSACTVGEKCYIFGGLNSNGAVDTINEIAFGATYTYNILQKKGEITYEEI